MKTALALLVGSFLSAHVADLSADAADGVWIQLIPAGTFSGRDGRGPYHAGDENSLELIAAVTRKYFAGNDIVVDYEHQSMKAEENGKPAPAAGWIKEVQARPEGLYGRVEWTANASAAIKAKEYRYLSPVYFHTKDGKILALRNAALTNEPNLTLAEVSAHSIRHPYSQEVSMKKIIAALGLSDGASEDDVLIAINSMLTSSTAIATAAGLTKDAKSDEIVAKVSAMRAGGAATVDPTKFVPIEQVTAMQADIKALQDSTADKDASQAVAEAIKDGKLIPALKDWALALHKADKAKFDEFVGKAPVLTSQQRATAKDPGQQQDGALDDAQVTAAKLLGIDPKAYSETVKAERNA